MNFSKFPLAGAGMAVLCLLTASCTTAPGTAGRGPEIINLSPADQKPRQQPAQNTPQSAQQTAGGAPQTTLPPPGDPAADSLAALENEILGTDPASVTLTEDPENPSSQDPAGAAQSLTGAAALTVADNEDGSAAPDGDPSTGASAPPAIVIPVDPLAEELPDYASGSGLNRSCLPGLGDKVAAAVSEITAALVSRLQVDPGNIYVAPTVMSDEYRNCIPNQQDRITSALRSSDKFTPVAPPSVGVAQNAGSGTIIPQLVRQCRQQGVPYLNYTMISKRGGKLRITMRFIRITDSVTLAQDYRNLE